MSFGEYSQINYGHTISTVDDAQAIVNVQTALQQRFDTNTAKVDEMIQKVSNIPLLRDKDKQYLGEKINGLLNTVNANLKASRGGGLLSNNVTAEINRYISSAIDDNVKKQMQNSKSIIDFQKGVSELKEKKPDTYSDGNYQYALDHAGYEKYMKGESDNLGTLEYVPYQDVMANAMKKAKDFKDLKGDSEVEMVNPANPKEIIKVKVSGLRPEDIINNIPGFLSERDKKQIAIDGYTAFRGNPQAAGKAFDSYISTKAENIQNQIKLQQAIIDDSGSSSPKQIEAAKLRKAQYEQDAKELETYSTSVKRDDIDTIGYTLKMSEITSAMSSMFSGRESRTVEVNEAYYKDANLAIELEKLEMQKAEAAQKGLKAKKNADGTVTYEGASADFIPTVTPGEEVPEVAEANFVKNVQQEHNKNYNTVTSLALSAYQDSTTPDAKKTKFEEDMRANGYKYDTKTGDFIKDPSYKGQFYSKAAAMSKAFFNGNMDDLYPEKAAQLVEADEKRLITAHGLEKAYRTSRTSINTDEVIDDLQLGLETLTSSQLARTFDVTELKANVLSSVSPLKAPTEVDVRRQLAASEIKSFIDSQGGLANLKAKARNNHTLLIKAQELFKKAAAADAALYEKPNGVDKQTADIAASLKASGMESFIPSRQTMQVTGDSVANIINRIPSFETTGAKFDLKAPITVQKTADGYTLTQFKGNDAKGNRLEATATITTESEAAKYIDANVGLDETYISTKDVPSGYKMIPKVKPEYVSSDNEGQIMSSLSKFNSVITDPNIKASRVLEYNTEDSTRKRIEAEFIGTPLEDSHAIISNKIIEGIDNNRYAIQVKRNVNTENWITEIYKDGTLLTATAIGVTDKINKDYMNLLKLYPHLLISEGLVNFVKRNERNITKL